jgi:hypothetical protein
MKNYELKEEVLKINTQLMEYDKLLDTYEINYHKYTCELDKYKDAKTKLVLIEALDRVMSNIDRTMEEVQKLNRRLEQLVNQVA